MSNDLHQEFVKWLDAHEEIVNMEAEEIALKAWRAGVEAAQQSKSPATDLAICNCITCRGYRGEL